MSKKNISRYLEQYRKKIINNDRSKSDFLTDFGPFGALFLLIIAFGILTNDFLTYNNIVTNVLTNSAILLLISLAGTFPILQQSIDLSVAEIATLTGVVTALIIGSLGILTIPVVILIGTFIGIINGVVFTKLKIPSFLVTLGMMEILHGLSLVLTDGSSIPFRSPMLNQISIGNIIPEVPNLVTWSFLAYFLTVFIAWRMKFGRYIYTIGENERAVELAGVNVTRYKILAFALSGALCGLAGLLLAGRITSASGSMATGLLIPSIAAIVMGGTSLSGGVGGPHRTILGVLVIAVLDNGMSLLGIDPFVQEIILGMMVIVAVALSLDRSKVDIVK